MKKTYNKDNLKELLEICSSYIDGIDSESKEKYFQELINTDLFTDAVGKITKVKGKTIEVITEY